MYTKNYPDKVYYFITITTAFHYPYFDTDEKKMLVLNKLQEIEKDLNIKFKHFCILMNHIHLLVFLEKGNLYSKLKQQLKGGISYEYGKNYQKKYKTMWQTSKVQIIYEDENIEKIEGYIIGNLLKHKEVPTFDQIYDLPFSSMKSVVDEKGVEYAKNLVFDVIEFEENSSGDVQFEKLVGAKAPDPG